MSKKKPAQGRLVPAKPAAVMVPSDLLGDVRALIEQARDATARAVNAALVLLYWQVGARLHSEVLKGNRAEYGQEILSTLSKELVADFGSGYSVPNLSRMLRLAEVFPDMAIVATLSKELGWSHFVEILPIKDPLKRDFYAEMCRIECWSVRSRRRTGPRTAEGGGRVIMPAEIAIVPALSAECPDGDLSGQYRDQGADRWQLSGAVPRIGRIRAPRERPKPSVR